MTAALWPEFEPSAAAANVRKALHSARRILHSMDGAEYIVSAGDLLFLPPGRLSVDVGDHEVLARFDGGRVLVGVTSTPFKCPPAPSETALMLHDLLSARGIRDRSRVDLVMPLGAPIPPSPAASAALLTAFAERGIGWHPNRLVRGLDPRRKVALLADGGELPFDLFLGVPVHRAPQVVLDSGMCVDGWIPVDSLTLRTRYEGVYAVGDVTSVGTPKAGVFAEGQAAVVAEQIIAAHRGDGASATYDGTGICFVEFGEERIGRVQVTFRRGERPFGTFDDASDVYRADKTEFGSSRVRRWFGRAWS